LQQCQARNFLGLVASAESEADGGFFYTLSAAPFRAPPGGSLRARLAEIRDRGGAAVIHNVADRIYGIAGQGKIKEAAAFILHLVTGPIFQAIDIGSDRRDLETWQALLQMGYRLTALAGGPGQIAPSGENMPAPGCYALLAPQASKPEDFLAAIAAGRIVASNGPFIRLLVDGAGIGDTIPPSSAPRQVLIEALASSYDGDEVAEVELIYNGENVGKWEGAAAQKGIRIWAMQEFSEPGWILAHYRSRRSDLWAFTNPIYVQSGRLGQPPPIAGDLMVFIRDRETEAALPGAVEVWSAGARCAAFNVTAKGQCIAVPFDARLRISSDGYLAKELWLAEEPALRRRLAEILARHPPAAWLAPETIQACRAALADLTLVVALERDAAAVDADGAERSLRQASAAEDANRSGLSRQ
ncbi:MAG: CehA/McbA family metallohydrolase, partial [Planctomycetota bacterium]|nr:CehA/McbA family metallohydrolase [Planctomycetota bacterium]